MLGVNYQDALGLGARSSSAEFKLTYPSLRDRDGQFADKYGSRAFPETFVIDRARQDRRPAPRAGRPGVAGPHAAAAAGREGVMRAVAARCSRCCWRSPRGAAPRATLPDIEDEVMCVECGTALNVSALRRRPTRSARSSAASIAQGKDQAAGQGGAGGRVRAAACSADPPSSGFDLAAWLVPILLALLAIARRRRSPRGAGAARAAPPRRRAAAASRSRRRTRAASTRELAAYDR